MKYKFVIVLCPWQKIDNSFPEFMNGKYLGGQTRMRAAARFFKDKKPRRMLIVGGYNEDDKRTAENESDKTRDMRDYLIDEGVPENQMSIVNSLPCTKHNLAAVFHVYKQDFQNGKSVGLLTNLYHLPRALKFWDDLREEYSVQSKPDPIVAEAVIVGSDRYTKTWELISRMEDELVGLLDQFAERYECKCRRKKFNKLLQNKGKELLTPSELNTSGNS